MKDSIIELDGEMVMISLSNEAFSAIHRAIEVVPTLQRIPHYATDEITLKISNSFIVKIKHDGVVIGYRPTPKLSPVDKFIREVGNECGEKP